MPVFHPRRRSVSPALAALAAVGLVLVVAALPATAQTDQEVTRYRVTISNEIDGQPLTPPVVALHGADQRLFSSGEEASEGLRQIAENGNNAPLVEALSGDSEIDTVTVAGEGPLVPASAPGSAMFDDEVTIDVPAGDATHLSFAAMLICTNDGFTGVNALELPAEPGETVTVHLPSYETHTEVNTEDFADIVPPCQPLIGIGTDEDGTAMSDPDLNEGGVISRHGGIEGIADLVPATHDWQDPVATLTVEALPDGRATARVAGANRYETAVAISQRAFPDGASVVYLANGQTMVDAMTGSVFTDGPILLVRGNGQVPQVVLDEIARLDPGSVVALGSDVVVSEEALALAAGS